MMRIFLDDERATPELACVMSAPGPKVDTRLALQSQRELRGS